MSARAHPRAVGVFVLVAIALVLGGVLVLSSGAWLQERQRFSVFFPGSVRGLGDGAPVTFRGVKIGEVVDVDAILTGKPDPLIQIEVVLEFRGNVVQVPQGVTGPFDGLVGQDFADALIRHGLRARMLSASLLTGQRYIELDFEPQEPARLAGLNPRYPELPTRPTALEKLGDQAEEFVNKIAELPLADMLDDVRTVIRATREVIDSDELRNAFRSANRTLRQLEPTLTHAREAMAQAEDLIETLRQEATVTGEEARKAMAKLEATLGDAESALATLDDTLRAADDTRLEASRTLSELRQTLGVMRNLAEYIQTHPEAVVLGKPDAEEND